MSVSIHATYYCTQGNQFIKSRVVYIYIYQPEQQGVRRENKQKHTELKHNETRTTRERKIEREMEHLLYILSLVLNPKWRKGSAKLDRQQATMTELWPATKY